MFIHDDALYTSANTLRFTKWLIHYHAYSISQTYPVAV